MDAARTSAEQQDVYCEAERVEQHDASCALNCALEHQPEHALSR